MQDCCEWNATIREIKDYDGIYEQIYCPICRYEHTQKIESYYDED